MSTEQPNTPIAPAAPAAPAAPTESIGHKIYNFWANQVQNPMSDALRLDSKVMSFIKIAFGFFIVICIISAIMSWSHKVFSGFESQQTFYDVTPQRFKDCAFDPKDPNGLLNSTCDGWNSTSSGFVGGRQNFSNDDTMNNMYQHFVPAGVKYQQKDKDDLPWGLGKCSDIVAEDSAQYGSDDYVDAVFAKSKQEQFYSPEEALLHQ